MTDPASDLEELKGDDEMLALLYCEYDCDEDDRAIGCLFPSQCCMPGFHFPSECHTADMIEAQHTDEKGQTHDS